MKDRTWSVLVSFNWTPAPATGLSSGSFTWPCRLRAVGSSFSFFCAGRSWTHATARTATSIVRGKPVRETRCMSHCIGQLPPLLLRLGDQQQSCIDLLLALNLNLFVSGLKPL